MGGFGRIKAMTGAKNFVDHGNGLSFMFPNSQRSKPNAVKIILEPDDTYTVTFARRAKGGLSIGAESVHRGIYFDQLKDLFEHETGLALSL